MRLQIWHVLIIVLVIVILFGAKRLPDVASSVGKSLKIFKKEIHELRDDEEDPATGQSGTSAPSTGSAAPPSATSGPPTEGSGPGRVPDPSATTPGGSDSSR